MQNKSGACVVVLGTGGTIAGQARETADNVGYRAAELGVNQLLAAVPGLSAFALQTEQVAQVDSKDMSHAIWQRLTQRVAAHLARAEVSGVVITHGTDTLEETAWFLQRVLAPTKPVVLTAAMRPATALMPDGPQNLLDAVTLAATPQVQGVLAVLGGAVHGPAEVRKRHPYRLDAFDSGEDGPLAWLQEGQLRQLRPWPQGAALGLDVMAAPVETWPWVAVVASHAGADARAMSALLAQGVDGVVVEGTGNGTVHNALEAQLQVAQARGLPVLRTSRCQGGAVVGAPEGSLPSAGVLSPARARVELLLQLLQRRRSAGWAAS